MPVGVPHYKDPDIVFGAFRVLPRTDGKWAVVDERRKPGERTVAVCKTQHQAVMTAKTWHLEGHG